MDGAPELLHATAVALRMPSGHRCALIRGPSGSGKSDLALRCIAHTGGPLVAERAVLVADDQVRLRRSATKLTASAPAALRGKIEVRGLGILEVEAEPEAEVALIVDLVARAEVPRLPPHPVRREMLQGTAFPVLQLHAFDITAHLKLLIALREPCWADGGETIARSISPT